MQSQSTFNRVSAGDRFNSEGDLKSSLEWSSSQTPTSYVVSGSSDYSQLSGLKNILLHLKQELFQGDQHIIVGNKSDDLARRFQLLEQHVDGLLRRKINFSLKDTQGGTRSLDYTTLLNEKQNQIVELERKISNIEDKLRKSSARETELERKLSALSTKMSVDKTSEYIKIKNDLVALENKFSAAASLWKSQLQYIKQRHPSEVFELDSGITSLLQGRNFQASVVNGVVQVQKLVDRTIEVPVQDVRTKSLIQRLTSEMKKLTTKYPQLKGELDGKLLEYVQQELTDLVEVDELDRLVQIVKYVPDVVRVDNVYSYSSDKSKRLEYHLRVLIKALLIELEKASRLPGVRLEVPESLLVMVRDETAGVIDVEDILHVFTVVPKIVEVERIVEKVVERVVEVPQVVVVEKTVEKIVEVPKIQEIEKIVHVPVEVVKLVDREVEKIVEVERIIERVVEVPQVTERIVEKIVEIPRIVEVEKIVVQHIPVTEVVEVEKIVNNTVTEIKEVKIQVEKIVTVEKIVEKIMEIPIYVEKIVEKVVEIPRIVEVERVIEKIVKVPEFKVVKENGMAFNTVFKEIERIVEKIVVVENTVERLVEVPQIIEKIVTISNQSTIIKEVEVIREKLVPVVEIKEVERVEKVIVTLIEEVQKVVERKVEVPLFQEKIVRVPEVITNVVIERVEVPRIIEVEKIVEKYITVTEIVKVQVPVVKYIYEPKVYNIKEEKIVEVPRTVERIKEVRVNVDRIIQKMVEVPKVVEVERVVEKIVVVPRIVERIVEVPQIVERIVDRVVEVEKIVEVIKEVQVAVEVQKVVEVEVVKTVFVPQEKLVEKIVEKLVPVEKIVEKVVNISNDVERIVAIATEIPKILEVERIVTKRQQIEKVVEVEKPTTLVVQVPVEVERIVTKVVPIERTVEKIVQVPQIIEKIVAVQHNHTVVQEVERIVERIVERQNSKAFPTTEVVVQENVKQVQVIVEKLVPVKQIVEKIVHVPQIVEKVIEKIVYVPQIVEVEKVIERIVEVPKYVQVLVNVPHLVKINQIFENIINNNVMVPVINEVIKPVNVDKEKIVVVVSEVPQVKEVEVFRDKIVEIQKFIEVNQTNNVLTKELQVVERLERNDVPVFTTVEKFIQIPQVNEKIVERIVIMPQVVQVLKYVHEIAESGTTLGLLAPDQAVLEGKLRDLSGRVTGQSEQLLTELRRLKGSQPNLRGLIEGLEGYLVDLNRLTSSQRILTVPTDRIVEKIVNNPVLLPTQDSASLRNELALSLLVEKLIIQLKRISKEQPNIKLGLDEDVLLMFFGDLTGNYGVSNDLQTGLRKFKEQIGSKLSSLGNTWSSSHELMLSTILQERFVLGNLIKSANAEIEKARSLADRRQESLRKYKLANTTFREKYVKLESQINDLLSKVQGERSVSDLFSRVRSALSEITQLWNRDVEMYTFTEEPMKVVGDSSSIEELRSVLESQKREAWATAELWKQKFLANSQSSSLSTSKPATAVGGAFDDRELTSLRSQVNTLNQEVRRLQSQKQNLQYSSNQGNNTAALESQLREAKANIEKSKVTSESQLSDLRRQATDLNRKISDYERKVTELEAKLASAQSVAVKPTSITTTGSYSGLGSSSLGGSLGASVGGSQGASGLNHSSQYENYTPNIPSYSGAYNSLPIGSGSGYNSTLPTKFTENLYTPSRTTPTNSFGEFKQTGGASKAPLSSSLSFSNVGDSTSTPQVFGTNYEADRSSPVAGGTFQFKVKGNTPLSSRKI